MPDRAALPGDAMATYLNTYLNRAKKQVNPAAKELLETVERKKSNLCVSVDVISSKDFLAIIDAVGPYVCLIKASPGSYTLVLFIKALTTSKLDPHRYH